MHWKKQKLKKFLELVGNGIIISHNASFDIRHINKELKKCGLEKINKENCICTMKILSNLKKYKLKDCAKY